MVIRTLKAKYESSGDSASCSHVILCHTKNTKEAYYQYEDEPEPPAEAVPTGTVSTTTTLVPAPIVAPVVDAAGPVASIPDAPIIAAEVLNVILSRILSVENQLSRTKFSVNFNRSSHPHLRKERSFLLRNSALPWPQISVVLLASTVPVSSNCWENAW